MLQLVLASVVTSLQLRGCKHIDLNASLSAQVSCGALQKACLKVATLVRRQL